MLKTAVVIPIFNGLKYTKACLNSFQEQLKSIDQDRADFPVIVVDDGSSDGSAEWIAENHPGVHVLKGTGDLWWSGGINMGVSYAIDKLHADYVLWWNNDILSEKNYFVNLVSILERNDTNTIIGSKIYMAQLDNTVWSMGGYFNPYTGEKDMRGRGQKDVEEYRKIFECDWLPGMGTIIHRSVYEKIGMVDNINFPQYHGDSDFTYRAKLAGFRIIADPSLVIYNDTRNSGLKHNESLKMLYQSMVTIRSNFNVRKNLLFYRKYAKSVKAYSVLIKHYSRYVGGFFKWKILGVFGKKRNEQ